MQTHGTGCGPGNHVMSWQIQIIRAKPNPTGKDTNHHRPIASQLLGEWVDLKNIGDAAVAASVLNLADSTFGPGCVIKEKAQIYWNGSSITLKPGETVRVHTGRSADSWQMAQVDRDGVNHHAYAESGSFVLNNDCGDNVSVWWKDQDGKWYCEDAASYRPKPTEGKILQRVGAELI